MRHAWEKASPPSRSRTSVNGGGSCIGSTIEANVVPARVRPILLFPFLPHREYLYEAGRRRESVPRCRREVRLAQPPKTILICSCEDTMHLDTSAVGRGC